MEWRVDWEWGGTWSQLDPILTCIACRVAAWSKVNTLRAGTGVTTRPEETEVGARSLTGVLDCKHRKTALSKAEGAKVALVCVCGFLKTKFSFST